MGAKISLAIKSSQVFFTLLFWVRTRCKVCSFIDASLASETLLAAEKIKLTKINYFKFEKKSFKICNFSLHLHNSSNDFWKISFISKEEKWIYKHKSSQFYFTSVMIIEDLFKRRKKITKWWRRKCADLSDLSLIAIVKID